MQSALSVGPCGAWTGVLALSLQAPQLATADIWQYVPLFMRSFTCMCGHEHMTTGSPPQVGAHPKDREHNMIGRAVAGMALLQIWEVNGPARQLEAATASSASRAPVAPIARLAQAICLDGGLVWDCKWQPGSQSRHRYATRPRAWESALRAVRCGRGGSAHAQLTG